MIIMYLDVKYTIIRAKENPELTPASDTREHNQLRSPWRHLDACAVLPTDPKDPVNDP